jgi:hypothetical protein
MAKKFAEVAKTLAQGQASKIAIEQPSSQSICLEIESVTPLLQNCFNQKAMEQMLRKHMGLSVVQEKKKPSEVIEAATIRNLRGMVCVPPTGIKKAMLTASLGIKGLKKTRLRPSIFIFGGSIPLVHSEMVPQLDIVRLNGRAPDVRFRPRFDTWRARFIVIFNEDLDVQTIIDLVQRAGQIGLCEWRPEKDGTYGTFKVSRVLDSPEEIAEVRDICSVPLKSLVIPTWALDMDIDNEMLAKIASGEGETEEENANGNVGDEKGGAAEVLLPS